MRLPTKRAVLSDFGTPSIASGQPPSLLFPTFWPESEESPLFPKRFLGGIATSRNEKNYLFLLCLRAKTSEINPLRI